MINISNSFHEFVEAAQQNKSAYLVGDQLTLTPTRGFTLPISFDKSGRDLVYIDSEWKRIEVILAGVRWMNLRWMSPLSEWQDITNLFKGYGMENDPKVMDIVKRYNMQEGHMLPFIHNDDYDIYLEKENGRFYLHCTIRNPKLSIIKQILKYVKVIQQDHDVDSYVYSGKPNKEYVLSKDTTFKFAELVGYKFFETVVLGDGFEHDIYKKVRDC